MINQTGGFQNKSRVDEMNKVIVIGLDGADFDLITELKDKLPNLKRIIENGTFCKLNSTIPNISPTAWVSFMTGKNPGKHGVIDFVVKEDTVAVSGRTVNATCIKDKTLWKILSDKNRKVIVFNVPCTYPPENVNGIVIGGFPLPTESTDYISPEELVGEFENRGWNFANVATQAYSKKHLELFLEELYGRLTERTDATIYLMKKYKWDFFMVHYMETDKVLHEFLNYKFKDFCHEDMHKQYKNIINDFFIEVDNQIGRILGSLDDNVNVFIVSDHGFAPNKYVVYLDKWLLSKGYIKLNTNIRTKLKYLLFKHGFTPENLYKLLPENIKYVIRSSEEKKYYALSNTGSSFFISKLKKIVNSLFLSKDNIDWKRTKAYQWGNTGFGTIYINHAFKFEKGYYKLKEELKKDLKEIKSNSNEPLFDKIYFREDIYIGDSFSKTPDIIAFDSSRENSIINHERVFLSNNTFGKIDDRASHGMNGILVAYGPDIKKNAGVEAELIDLAPTLLHIMNTSIPRDMDGKVLKEIFKNDSFIYKSEIVYENIESGFEYEEPKVSKKDEEEMMWRLKRMGYLA